MKFHFGIVIVALALLMLPNAGNSKPRRSRRSSLKDVLLKRKSGSLNPRSPRYGYGYGSYLKPSTGSSTSSECKCPDSSSSSTSRRSSGYGYGYGLHDEGSPAKPSPLKDMLFKRKSGSLNPRSPRYGYGYGSYLKPSTGSSTSSECKCPDSSGSLSSRRPSGYRYGYYGLHDEGSKTQESDP